MVSFEGEVYSEWTQEVDDIAKANLNKPLLVRHPHTKKISVNFDPQVNPIGSCVDLCTVVCGFVPPTCTSLHVVL